MTLDKKTVGFLTSSGLKWIAIITMIIDHIGATLFPVSQYPDMAVLRIIGRIAFPIFAFLLVEGFRHTRNVKGYGARLLLFAFISEIPFDLAFFRKPFYFGHQNVFFTLFLGLMALVAYRHLKARNVFLSSLSVFAIALLAQLLETDYGMLGVMLMVLLYAFDDQRQTVLWIVTVNVLFFVIYMNPRQLYAVMSIPFILMYNGEPGRRLKYLFYGIYPVHLVILYLVETFV